MLLDQLSGISRQDVAKWEAGTSEPTFKLIELAFSLKSAF